MEQYTKLDDWEGLVVSGDRYHIQSQIGVGGMASVYLAHDRNLECDVVLKVPRQAMLEDATFRKRFKSETRSLVKLRHPHIVSVLDVGEHESIPFAVMQHLSGGTLLDRYNESSLNTVLRSLENWLPQCAQAIDFLHDQGFVHRDIKPENILFDEHGLPYLGDFGVVKCLAAVEEQSQTQNLTRTGVVGTPEYMAPEMILGEKFDGKIDQYALGVTLYELIAKRRPFESATGTAVLVAQTTQAPPPIQNFVPELEGCIANAIARSLLKKPDQRFLTCAEFAGEITSGALSKAPEALPDNAKLDCPSCYKTLLVPRTMAGRSTKCPKCRSSVTVSIDLKELSNAKVPAMVGHRPPTSVNKPVADDASNVERKVTTSVALPTTDTNPALPNDQYNLDTTANQQTVMPGEVGVVGTANTPLARRWTSRNGEFQIIASLFGYEDDAVSLRKEDGAILKVHREQLSDADLSFLDSLNPSKVSTQIKAHKHSTFHNVLAQIWPWIPIVCYSLLVAVGLIRTLIAFVVAEEAASSAQAFAWFIAIAASYVAINWPYVRISRGVRLTKRHVGASVFAISCMFLLLGIVFLVGLNDVRSAVGKDFFSSLTTILAWPLGLTWLGWLGWFGYLLWTRGPEMSFSIESNKLILKGSILNMIVQNAGWVISRKGEDCFAGAGSAISVWTSFALAIFALGPSFVLLVTHKTLENKRKYQKDHLPNWQFLTVIWWGLFGLGVFLTLLLTFVITD